MRAQLLSSGAMHTRTHGPICGGIHLYGAAFGVAFGAAPDCFGFHGGGCCHMWDLSYHAWHQNLNVAKVAIAGASGNFNLSRLHSYFPEKDLYPTFRGKRVLTSAVEMKQSLTMSRDLGFMSPIVTERPIGNRTDGPTRSLSCAFQTSLLESST